MKIYRLSRKLTIDDSLENVWNFYSNPGNLPKITPPELNFKIVSELQEEIYEGMIIQYTVSPVMGIPMTWLSEITHLKKLSYFVDEQRCGPYKIWHHEHFIEKTASGILSSDLVTYAIPGGFLGQIVHHLFIKKQLNQIFDFREKALKEYFKVIQ